MTVNERSRSLDNDWKFSLSDVESAKEELFDDSGWRILNLPHDWSIEGSYRVHHASGKKCGFLPAGVAWYRKTIHVSEEWIEKSVYIEFDGVYMNSDVWVNGHHLGNRPYGCVGFEHELTPYLHPGANVIAVRVDCSRQPSSRWYNGSGIYRHVWLKVLEKVHFAHWGICVTTPEIDEKRALINVKATVCNKGVKEDSISVSTAIIHPDGHEIDRAATNCTVAALSDLESDYNLTVENPMLWSPQAPVLYSLLTKVYKDGREIDQYTTPLGIRYFEFVPEKGFFLNGIPMKFKGVCNHHDGGPVGAAVPDGLLEKRLLLLKEMGCNAIRTSHNPFAPEFYDMCDRLGIMVMDEAFDGWEEPKMPDDYGIYFNDWWKKDLHDLILRDRNHPCIILWSLGNEIHNMKTQTTKMLRDYVHELEPTRPVTCGVNGTSDVSDENRALLDVAGYNDGGGACFVYAQDHKKRPMQCLIATEAPHTYQTRGFYRTQTWWRDKNQPRMEIPNLTEEEIFFDGDIKYNSSYDNSGVRTCARDSWELTEKHPYLCGEFRWTGFDYLGESFGWPHRMGNYGVIDAANFKKDHFYLYQSMWSDEPMIHLLPHWTHNGMEGVVIPVWVYTNCQEAELFLNGESLGKKGKGNKKNLSWDVEYQPGTIKAVGYIDQIAIVEKEYRTAGEPESIRLTTDKEYLQADGRDVAQVTFAITDKNGVMNPKASNAVNLVVLGPGKLIGTENGDPGDLTPAKSALRKAFNGLGMGVVQSTLDTAKIEVAGFGILGEKVFEESTMVSIAYSSVSLRGGTGTHDWKVFFTTDGTAPDKNSKLFTHAFKICMSTVVKAIFYMDDIYMGYCEERFTRGKMPEVIDLIHSNKELQAERTLGPFAEQAAGEWTDGRYKYVFKPDGVLVRKVGDELEQTLGFWWYDFPVDNFEAQEYAGTGEIWFNSGEERKISLLTQAATEMKVDVEGAVNTALGSPKELQLYRKK